MPQHNFTRTQPEIQATDNNGALALDLAALGWFVFPCREKPGEPYTVKRTGEVVTPQAKAPYWHKTDLPNGKDNATTEPAIIKRWWARWPGALIGVYCERSGFFALDIDVKDGRDGVATWGAFLAQYDNGELLEGPIQTTPSGGYHLLFNLPDGLKIPNDANKLGAGLDLRSNGYICTGGPYRWLEDHTPAGPIYDAPAWLLDLIAGLNAQPERRAPAIPAAPGPNGTEPGAYWLRRYLDRVTVGNRNSTGFALACQLRDSGMTQNQAALVMGDFARSVPGQGYTEGEALASCEQAYLSPPRQPATLPGERRTAAAPQAAPPQPDDFDLDPIYNGNGYHAEEAQALAGDPGKNKPVVPTEDELATRWLLNHPDTAYGMGEFRRYAGGIWQPVPLDEVKREITNILKTAKLEGLRPTTRMVNSVTEMARLEIVIPADKWDAQHDYLVCKNGALHIPTRTLQPHKREHYATSRLDFDYDPGAWSDIWEYVLNSCIPSAKDFIQEFAGLALTTDTRYELAVWLYGPPGSGKSTVLTGLQAMLGARAGILGLADIERSRFSLADLPGKTLMVSAEQPESYLQASHVLNAIISGEPVTVERKFSDQVTIVPRAKLAWAMNELPRVNMAGSGLFRRVKVIIFPSIAPKNQDPEIKERVKTQGAAILNWALDGLDRLRARGKFEVPDCVENATRGFKDNNDIPLLFVTERCVTGPDYKTQGSLLYTEYKTWCIENGHKPQSSTTVAEDWRRLGFEKYLAMGKSFWRGVGLVSNV